MGETERRRRRVRPATATAAESVTDGTAAAAPKPISSAAETSAVPRDAVPRDAETSAVGDPEPATMPAPNRTPGEKPFSGVGWRPGPFPARPTGPRPPAAVDTAPRPPGTEERDPERGLRGLVGSGSSQVSPGAALRARDAARPTDEQLAEAETTLMIVRRNWLPREELPRR